jgi:hypothetical protein
MSKSSTQSLSHKKRVMPSKLIMGLMVAAISVFAGTASVANAAPGNSGNGYGGINIDLGNIVGDNNVIVIIVNYFAGR